MKDQYVGDVKDYFKYALLRALGSNGLPLVLCWMLTPPDGSNHGGKTHYLRDGRFRELDPELHDSMDALLTAGDRSIAAIERSPLLRTRYVRTMDELRALALPPSLVFLDPDMGFEVASVKRGSPRAAQYVYWQDADALLDAGHSLIVFQHRQRRPWGSTLAPAAVRVGARADVRAVVVGNEAAFVLLARHEQLARHVADFVTRCPPSVWLWP